jgi:Uma2 family endonuclease
MSTRIVKRKPNAKLRFGPMDHGRAVSTREIETAEYALGFQYEIIHGRLYVSPVPNAAENILERWLRRAIEQFSDDNPDIINYVTNKGRLILPEAEQLTSPEPDIAAYANFPLELPYREVVWEQVSPILVCEILVDSDLNKDLVRNPELYLQVPSIREYWIVSGVENPDEPTLIQYIRRGKKWTITTHAFGSTFTPKVLPGFSLTIDPRKR